MTCLRVPFVPMLATAPTMNSGPAARDRTARDSAGVATPARHAWGAPGRRRRDSGAVGVASIGGATPVTAQDVHSRAPVELQGYIQSAAERTRAQTGDACRARLGGYRDQRVDRGTGLIVAEQVIEP